MLKTSTIFHGESTSISSYIDLYYYYDEYVNYIYKQYNKIISPDNILYISFDIYIDDSIYTGDYLVIIDDDKAYLDLSGAYDFIYE